MNSSGLDAGRSDIVHPTLVARRAHTQPRKSDSGKAKAAKGIHFIGRTHRVTDCIHLGTGCKAENNCKANSNCTAGYVATDSNTDDVGTRLNDNGIMDDDGESH
ncbi:hypothetical protein PG996_008959 [Apiospora saccharicola]|uniref:Pectate lyase n=1 Tax=Apiospora saccharicola TaxID=335842 RepID=A0ABR1UZE9_9PEZI